ncbi:hypothetical protein SLEP1_g31542 [Rubroshorea leprosula]|uniref:Uncharacterized protein n=1 Tax=Rubroshorea leprosula TaxID=152421 RepID=A0AAV5KA03_9ROSI|nr:hypothetical protein SLEP1_g31542 [Rubroshorea leprosula]
MRVSLFCLRCGHVISDPASGDYTLAHVDMLLIEPVRSTLLVGVIHQQIVCLPVRGL